MYSLMFKAHGVMYPVYEISIKQHAYQVPIVLSIRVAISHFLTNIAFDTHAFAWRLAKIVVLILGILSQNLSLLVAKKTPQVLGDTCEHPHLAREA